MSVPVAVRNEKMAQVLVKNLQSRNFGACYCATKEEALRKALSLIPENSTVGWGGATSAAQIGLIDAVKSGPYTALDRETAKSAEERNAIAAACLTADVFLVGANALSMDGQMVNIDGIGNRLAAIAYGPKQVIVIAGVNKVCPDLDSAIRRARTVAAPINHQRFPGNTPCVVTGVCGDCKSDDCICNQMLITRNCRPAGRIQIILVGESLGF